MGERLMPTRSLAVDEVPVIGAIAPMNDGVDVPYWEGLMAGELRVQRCQGCGTWCWTPAWRCGTCGSTDLAWEVTPARGTVYSWIRTWQAFSPEMAPVVPYVNVLVELPEAGSRRMHGILVGDEDGLEIGAPVIGVIQAPSALTNDMAVLRWQLERSRA
jgi:uncharacterized OB-fold protein